MALFRPSAIVGALSGSIGGITFTTGKGASVARHRPLRSQRTSASLNIVHLRFANVVRTWSTLSVAERATWRALAANLPRTNRLGQASPHSGFTLFAKRSLLKFHFFGTFGTSLPSKEGGILTFNFSVAATAPATIVAQYQFLSSKNAWTVQIAASRSFSTIQPKFPSAWRTIYTDTRAPLGSLEFDLSTGWNAVFGPLITQEAISVRARVWDTVTMFLPSPWSTASTITLAP